MTSCRPLRSTAVALGFVAIAAAVHAKDTGMAFVSSEKDNALAVIDVKSLAIAGTIPTCKRPRHMQFLPDGSTLMVACGDSNRADLIDVAARKVVGNVPLGEDPEAFDLSPDGKFAYVSNEDDGALNIVDLASKKIVKSIPVGKE